VRHTRTYNGHPPEAHNGGHLFNPGGHEHS
jgi:hypothetical protein